LGLWEGGIIIIQSELRSFCISGVLYSNHFATYWGQLVQFEEQSLKIPEAEAFVMTCRRAFQFKSFSPQQHRTNDGSFHMFYKENASKMCEQLRLIWAKSSACKILHASLLVGPFQWMLICGTTTTFQLCLKIEGTIFSGGRAYRWSLSSWVHTKKMGHLLPFDHGACPSHCTSDFGVPGYNPCEASSPARKLETNELLWCWYRH